MNAGLRHIIEEIRGAWRFRWLAVALALLIAGVGWAFVFALPDRYEATAQVLVDTRTALKPALQGLAMEQDVGEQLDYVRESLLATPQLHRIAQFAGILPASGLDPVRTQLLLDRLRRHIQLTVQSGGDNGQQTGSTSYGIVYQDSDRARSLKLVGILLSTLVNETLGGKREGAENAQQFLEAQIKDYERRLRLAEDRLADFKAKHVGVMPTEQGGSFTLLQKETDAIADLKTKLITAESRRATLQRQLHGDSAVAATGMGMIGPNGAPVGMDTASRIAQTQAHLDELLLRFTEKHPDVIAARRTLEELKQRRAAEVASLRRGDVAAAAASGASTNPVYQSIQLALNNVDVEISDVNVELSQHEAKAKELRELLNTAPQVEAEYQQLTRDYDVDKAQYTALLSNYEKSRLGERADTAGSVRFEVVQPPIASFKPVWPRRTVFLTLVLLLAIGGGGALAYALNRLRPVVISAKRLTEQTGIRVLGIVGPAFPTSAEGLVRSQIRQVAVAIVALIACFAIILTLSRSGVRLDLGAINYLV
jgi:polysaccharide chain length determinant protein (PEP-CTERM system associated)